MLDKILVTEGDGRCLLGSSAAKRPELVGVYSVGSDIESIANHFPKVCSGFGKLSGY